MLNEFTFTYLDREQDIEIYQYHLPHWQQEGTLNFVTFRLADSIPASVLDAWAEDRRQWLAKYGITENLTPDEWKTRYQKIPRDIRQAYERKEMRQFHGELDQCHGACPLRNPDAAKILADAMHFYHGKRLHCGDFIIMLNHAHWILSPYPGQKLQDLLASVKRYSAVRINKLTNKTGQLWQHESFDHIVRNEGQLLRIRSYIHDNPIKAKLLPGESLYYEADWLSETLNNNAGAD